MSVVATLLYIFQYFYSELLEARLPVSYYILFYSNVL